MNLLSFLSCFALFVYLYMGIYVLRLDKKASLNRIFFVLCISFAIWSFTYAMVYPETDKDIARIWYNFSSLGWIGFTSIVVHFFFRLTNKKTLLTKWWFYIILYGPPVVFIFKVFNGGLILVDFQMTKLGEVEVLKVNTLWAKVYFVYYFVFITAGLLSICIWRLNSRNYRIKKQANIIAVSTIPVATLGTLSNQILPILNIRIMPGIAQIVCLAWIFGIWVSIVKCKFMVLKPQIAVEEIISKVQDLLILIDNEEKILEINPRVKDVCGYQEYELIGKPASTIITNLDFSVDEDHVKLKKGFESFYNTKEGILIPVSVSGASIQDISGDFIGTVIVAQDLRIVKQLEKEIIERGSIEKNLIKSNASVKNLLNNVGQGFLSFGQELTVNPDYSEECKKIFKQSIEQLEFCKLIFPEDPKEQRDLQKILNSIFNEQDINRVNILLTLLPEEVITNDRNIKIEYRFIQDNLERSKIMAILTDVTDKYKLINQIEQERNILKMVVRVVVNLNEFADMVRDYSYFFSIEYLDVINSEIPSKDKLSYLLRRIHTFKGNFSQMDMICVVEELHSFEDKLIEQRNKVEEPNFRDLIDIFKENDMNSWLEKDIFILEDVLGKDFLNREGRIQIENSRLQNIENDILSLLSRKDKEKVSEKFRQIRYKSLREMLYPYSDYMLKLADRIEKSIYPIAFQGDDIYIDREKYQNFIKSLVHVFRNAVDHGIEYPEERLEKGKDVSGSIKCDIKILDDKIIMCIEDDGNGIDYEKVLEKCKARGVINEDDISNLTEEEVIRKIFDEEISTKEVATDISGRGIGLNAVKQQADKLGIHIYVETEKEKGTSFKFVIPLVN